ncbi:AAA family ATPase [Corynebacterium ulceribovis]|uniref:AAA family ATPase n=1 Tax=Corynebacterium ulceribovis TaxID=487732 RepID=UPI0004773BC5|nr:AAA family ATPase [Corynebacterium ulceribovis]
MQRSRPARRWIVLAGALTATATAATVTMGLLIAGITVGRIGPLGQTHALPHAELWATFGPTIAALAALAAVRIVVSWALARFGTQAAAAVTADLRRDGLRHLAVSDQRTVDRAYWQALLTTGIDGLKPYISGFLPSLVALVLATPIALAAVAWLDFSSFLIAMVTLPLIPLFMWLIGVLTQGKTQRRLADIGILREQILDLARGLPTLRAHHAATAPTSEIRRLSNTHRDSSMSVLRIAFLSGTVLEFFATISIALVAVSIGFRLLDGSMDFAAGLGVLIIIPEVYGPVRDVGKRFHDAQDGTIAATAVLDVLVDEQAVAPADPTVAAPLDVAAATTPGWYASFADFSVLGRDGIRPHHLTVVARPGELTVLAGPNGSGKSTALLGLLGLISEGLSGVAGVWEVSDQQPPRRFTAEDLWRRTAYLPQRPVLDPDMVGDTTGLSLGQRQRAALAAELAGSPKQLVVLDEPTAHLDSDNAAAMLAALRAEADRGATVVIASHDPLVLAAADQVVDVSFEVNAR